MSAKAEKQKQPDFEEVVKRMLDMPPQPHKNRNSLKEDSGENRDEATAPGSPNDQ